MALTCRTLWTDRRAPEGRRVVLPEAEKARVLSSICADCWAQWEAVEIRIINEYRLSFGNPTHRKQLQEACVEFISSPRQS